MKMIIQNSGRALVLVLVLTMSACFEIETFNSKSGDVVFKGFGLDLFQTGGANDRVLAESTWKHVYKNSAKIEIENKVSGQKYTLDYNPNNFTQAYRITLPFGNYTFSSVVEGGEFEAFLPFEVSGEFTLSSESMDIILQASTDYGLVTVKNQYVSSAAVSTGGKTPVNLALLGDESFRFIYVRDGIPTKLEITESYSGTTIERNLNIVKYRHYNFILELSEGNVNFIDLVMGPFEYEEEVIQLVSGKFYDANGTIKCPDAEPGDKGMVNGKLYEAVDNDLLRQRIYNRYFEEVDITCLCTSLVTDMSGLFEGSRFKGWTSIDQPIGNWDVSNVTNMSRMFYLSGSFNQSIGNWDVSNVTNMSEMFYQSGDFNKPIGIGNWDVSNVTNMSGMFYNSDINQPIGDWNVKNVTDMSEMFSNSKFNQPIGNWDVGKVTTMQYMFSNTPFNQPIGNWDVSNVTDMSYMFSSSQFNQPIGNWDVSSVTNMISMFYTSVFNQPIGNWNVGNVTNMSGMFEYSGLFNQPIDNWDLSNVTDMTGMFFSSVFNQPIGNWDVSNVTNMRAMFGESLFDQPLSNWNVSNVTNMSGMFISSSFNQNISTWCVTNQTSEPGNFSYNSPLTEENKPVWGTCPD
ncbi:BspA family leucine-rich repeat surface protein [Cyclobacteriaceae bacterium YHN15]|nr:BspA family leucine-rich repeat surface protein [Cyclobacteriaceae bacterium YHN15]